MTKQDLISAKEVCKLLDISYITLYRWYNWYNDDNYDKPKDLNLPDVHILGWNGDKYFKASDIKQLARFKIDLSRGNKYHGAMAQYFRDKQNKEKSVNE